MKTITVLSGKGGTGKTSIAAAISVLIAKEKKIVAVDCDVDASNLALILGVGEKDFDTKEAIKTSEKAELIKEKCTSCKKCFNACRFSAIEWDEKANLPIFDRMLCEGCGVCKIVCPENAIKMVKLENATIGTADTIYGFPIVSGQLKMGESGSGKIVAAVKQRAEEIAKKNHADIMIVDSSAGIGCPVIASVQGSDFVVAITEPTPSAFSDMKRALKVVEHFSIPCGIIINKWDINKEVSKDIEAFANKNQVPFMGKLPYDKRFVEALVNLKPIVIYDKSFESLFLEILNKIKKKRKF